MPSRVSRRRYYNGESYLVYEKGQQYPGPFMKSNQNRRVILLRAAIGTLAWKL